MQYIHRSKCYLASLRGEELPNPQSILGMISKQTKTVVSKTGLYSVASLHSVVGNKGVWLVGGIVDCNQVGVYNKQRDVIVVDFEPEDVIRSP